ncbi:Acetyltransferase (GNAT) family protein [compost metagenome]
MKQVKFRAATLDDIPQLVNLRFLMVNETSGVDPNQRTPEFEKDVRDYFEENLSNGSFYSAVAECDGQLVSMNGLVLYRKPPTFKGTTGIVGYVTSVYTIPEFRKRGIAGELMKLLVAHAKEAGAGKIHLGTTDDGRKLYEKSGFKDVTFPALELRL